MSVFSPGGKRIGEKNKPGKNARHKPCPAPGQDKLINSGSANSAFFPGDERTHIKRNDKKSTGERDALCIKMKANRRRRHARGVEGSMQGGGRYD